MTSTPSAEKAAVVAEVREKLAAADAALVTEYRGMTVGSLASLRRALRQHGAEYKVYKNTLARFGAKEAGYEGLSEMLVGPSAITFVKGDAAAAAKALRDHASGNPLLVLKGGVISGKTVDANALKVLADLPSKDVLQSQLLGVLQAPASKLARLLNEPAASLARVLKAKGEQAA